jgi:hypothetical protein
MRVSMTMNLFTLARYGYTWKAHVERETCSMTKQEAKRYIDRLLEEYRQIQEEAKIFE